MSKKSKLRRKQRQKKGLIIVGVISAMTAGAAWLVENNNRKD